MTAGTIGGRYRLERELGHGSMGEVWLATDTELERPVALKLLAPDADEARFDREARAAAALSHPNVIRLYDYGKSNSRSFMALEYVAGGTLEDRLPAGHRLKDEETSAIAMQLAAGLGHAHEHGLVHRDLKPANVLFDNEDRPKIADFGIASIGNGPTLTDPGTVMGTAAYISPEQAAGERATPASDVYSFGVILFRMLTGRFPFDAETPLELVDMHRRLDAPAVEVLRSDAPPRLAALANAALARDPRERPADGAALAADLGVDTGAPTTTGADTLILRRRPKAGRRLATAFLIVALLLLAAGGLTGPFLLTRKGTSRIERPTPRTHARPTSTEPSPAPARATSSTQSTTTQAATTPVAPPAPTTIPTTAATTAATITTPAGATTITVPQP